MALKDLIAARSSTSLESPSAGSTDDGHLALSQVTSSADEQSVDGGSSEDLINQVSEPDENKLAEASRLSTGSRPENEAEGVSPIGPHSENEAPSVPLDSQIPRGVNEVTTPSGIQIYYQAAPKREYRVNAKVVPSVTTVLDILEKGGLPFWGMKVGVAGVLQLGTPPPVGLGLYLWESSVDAVVSLLTEHKLTVNHVRDQAGDRGQSVHDALEAWAEKGIMPHPVVFPPEEQGYVQALRDFLIDSGAEAVASEVMVGSVKHKYAGRYDLDATLLEGAEVVTKTYPKKKPIRKKITGGLWRLDLKSSKNVYDTHFLQLEAYEQAAVECGYEATEHRGVIHVTEDGRYELVESKATFSDFKAVLGAYRALERLKTR